MLDPELIRSFLAVARCRSFSKAADTLYVSRSTISRSVTFLEEQLGVRLLDRSTRSVALTRAGAVLFERGGKVLAELEQLDDDVREAGRGQDGQLSAASIAMYSSPLFEVYRSLCSEHPDIQLTVEQMALEAVNESVITGRADIGITLSFALPADEENYIIKTIAEGNFCAVVPSGHPLTQKQTVHISDLQDETRLSLDSETAPSSFEVVRNISKATGGSTPELRAHSLESLAMQVKAGVGVVTLPEHAARQFGEGCSLLQLEGVETRYALVVFSRRDNRNPALRLFWDTAATLIGK